MHDRYSETCNLFTTKGDHMAKKFQNLINGKWVDAKSGRTFENRNPANWDELIGTFPKSGKEDVDEAVGCARTAFEKWRLVPAPKRGDIMRRVGDIMVERKEELARQMTREMGKVLAETRGDVQEGIDTAYYAAGEGRRLFGHTVPSELPTKPIWLSVFPSALPDSDPVEFPDGHPDMEDFPALLSATPLSSSRRPILRQRQRALVEILVEAGVPEGVVNIVHGGGGEVGMAIVGHPDVDLISFTGSTVVGIRSPKLPLPH